jgi:nitronate monooxygenase
MLRAPLPRALRGLRVPVVGAPLFIISNPALVIAQCTAGVLGSFPALNARSPSQLDEWLHEITEALAAHNRAHPSRPAAPFAINQIVHKSNSRLESDLAAAVKWRVPVTISSLGARADVNDAMHGVGGVVLHDVTNVAHARKAIDKGADGLVAVCAGAGGHAGSKHPFALLQEIRAWFAGPLLLSGAIATGRAVLAAQVAGADLAYVGSAFIATHEARASEEYKAAVVQGTSDDIVGTPLFTGVFGNYLKVSIAAAGLDPERLPEPKASATADVFGAAAAGGTTSAKAWRDIWGCGQGIGAVDSVVSAGQLVERLADEYAAAVDEVAHGVARAREE